MFSCQLCDFQSFIEINLGLCIAYLALPRFRYQRRIQEAFLHFHKEKEACIAQYQHRKSKKGEKGEQKNEDSATEVEDTSAFRDAYLTEITKKEKQFGENEYGSNFFKEHFKPKTRIGIGIDQRCVSILVMILFFLLATTTIWPKYPTSAWLLLFVGFGFFIPLFLIKSGIKHISEIETLLKNALGAVRSTYSIDQPEASISEMIKMIINKQESSSDRHY